MTTVTQLGLLDVLRIRAVRRLWIAQLVSIFGDFLVIFAVLSHASFDLRTGPVQITMIIVFFLVPYAFLGPAVGVFVDRWNIRRTMIASDLVRAALVLILVFADNLFCIYLAMFLLSAVSTFFVPAQIVAIRVVTPPGGLISANAVIQQTMPVVRMITPALAGTMVAWFGARPCYWIDSASFLISAATIATLSITREPAAPAKGGHPLRTAMNDLMAGVKFAFTHETLAGVILAMAAVAFALSCIGPLIAVYVRDQLKSGEFVFGIINSLLGAGMIVATLTAGSLTRRAGSNLLVLGLLAMAGGALLLATQRNIPAASIGLFAIGLGCDFVLVPGTTMVQAQTPIAMIGRVSGSLWALMSWAQLPGLLLAGPAAQHISITFVFTSAATILGLTAALERFGISQVRSNPTTVADS